MISTATARLDNLRARAEDRGINLALVERAETWLNALRQVCGPTWREPDYVFYDDVEAEIQFTWYGRRDLGIAVKLDRVEYIKMWGPDINNHMLSGTISTAQEQMSLWRWLREQERQS